MACDWQRQMPPRPACIAWGQPASPCRELEDGASTPVPRVGRGLPACVPGEKGLRDGSRAPPTHWETAAASLPLSEWDAHTPCCYDVLYCNPEPPFCSFLLFCGYQLEGSKDVPGRGWGSPDRLWALLGRGSSVLQLGACQRPWRKANKVKRSFCRGKPQIKRSPERRAGKEPGALGSDSAGSGATSMIRSAPLWH